MNRREFVSRVGVGSAGVIAVAGSAAAARREEEHDHHPLNGALASATVAFGAWVSGGKRPA